ncbi:hypothetical protein EDC04DRAFT_2568234, partial [Pisolithus marmoratus]
SPPAPTWCILPLATSADPQADESMNVTLLHVGLLGCLPSQPCIAIRLECLKLYHQIQCHQSSFSLQAMMKVLCALQNITYTQQLCTQLSAAFDIYLNILQSIHMSLQQALGHDGPAWKLCGACPACAFKVRQPDKPLLIPAQLHSMDGNQSAKCLDGSGSADS